MLEYWFQCCQANKPIIIVLVKSQVVGTPKLGGNSICNLVSCVSYQYNIILLEAYSKCGLCYDAIDEFSELNKMTVSTFPVRRRSSVENCRFQKSTLTSSWFWKTSQGCLGVRLRYKTKLHNRLSTEGHIWCSSVSQILG